MNEILTNLQRHVFYHGTQREVVDAIRREGFRKKTPASWDSCLRNGIYITCNWRWALHFGQTLLRVELAQGTRILNAEVPPDRRVLDSLRREFGAGLLRGEPPRKLIPANKRLTCRELVELVRYYYHEVFGPRAGGESGWDWPAWRLTSRRRLVHDCRSLLLRYGFDGFGSPASDIGIVVFGPDRVRLKTVVVTVPEAVDMTQEIGWGLPHFKTLGHFVREVEQMKRRQPGRSAPAPAARNPAERRE